MSLDSLPPSLFDTKHTCAALCSLETSHESCLELPNRADHVQNLSSDKLRVQLLLCCKSRCWPQSESECGKSVSSGVKGAARQFSTPIMLLGVSMDGFKIGSAELVLIILSLCLHYPQCKQNWGLLKWFITPHLHIFIFVFCVLMRDISDVHLQHQSFQDPSSEILNMKQTLSYKLILLFRKVNQCLSVCVCVCACVFLSSTCKLYFSLAQQLSIHVETCLHHFPVVWLKVHACGCLHVCVCSPW